MAFVFNFPDVGEGIHEGRVVEWLVTEGEVVAEDQPLVKVETDKAVVELPSPKAGTILRLHAAGDADIFVGDPLVTIGEEGEDPGAEQASEAAPEPSVPAGDRAEPEKPAPAVAARRPLATPRTRAMARKLGVDLATVRGSGPGGHHRCAGGLATR